LLLCVALIIHGHNLLANCFRNHPPPLSVVLPLFPFHSRRYLSSHWTLEHQLWLIHQLLHSRHSELDCRLPLPLSNPSLSSCSFTHTIYTPGSLHPCSSLSLPIHLLIPCHPRPQVHSSLLLLNFIPKLRPSPSLLISQSRPLHPPSRFQCFPQRRCWWRP